MSPFPVDAAFDRARLNHLASLNLDLEGKRVLEIGAGIGELTYFWEERDCEIVSTEGRQEHIESNLIAHPWRRGTLFQVDLSRPNSHATFGQFDVVFAYGILYHVPNPETVIKEMAALSSLILVETMVHGGSDIVELNERQEFVGDNQGLYPMACTPTRSWFMETLRLHYGYAYATKQQPCSNYYPISWPSKPNYLARAVFVGSKTPLNQDTLLEELPKEQTYVEPV